MSAWSKEPPTEPGWYWAREFGNDRTEVVRVVERDGRLVIPDEYDMDGGDPVSHFGVAYDGTRNALWGPRIQPPEEPWK